MSVISLRTKVFGVIALIFFVVEQYRLYLEGCGIIRPVEVSDFSPCNMWQSMQMVDEVVAVGTFCFGVAFVGSLGLDVAAWFKGRNANRS